MSALVRFWEATWKMWEDVKADPLPWMGLLVVVFAMAALLKGSGA